jgi:hypothetical protein
MATDVPLGTLQGSSPFAASALQSIAYEARQDWIMPCIRSIEGRERRGAMIVLLMIGVLACLLFLCVSPLIGHLASRQPESAPPSKSRRIQKEAIHRQPIQKPTLSAR